MSGTGYIPAEVIETQQRDNETAAKAAIDRFTQATTAPGVSAEPLTLAPASPAPAINSAASRGASTSPSSARPSRETARSRRSSPKATLFESGRPMIVVPYIQKAPLKLDNVMVCWDGSRQAARAVGDAMPLLAKAGRVEIVIITNERGKQDEIEGADIGQHLARHKLKVDVKRIFAGGIDVADALLSHAADAGADFMVMGGYGHSRLREFVLGGVTHRSCTR